MTCSGILSSLCLWVCVLTTVTLAQEVEKKYFDASRKECEPQTAQYYRHLWKDTDTSYVFEDYFIGGAIQMRGRSRRKFDPKGEIGTWTFYYYNGQKEGDFPYVDGLREGEELQWYPDGSIYKRGSYHNGKKVGVWKSFRPDGSPLSQEVYADGRTVGEWIDWHPNGQISERRLYDSATYLPLEWKHFYDDGTLEGERSVDDSDGTYRWTWWDRQQKLCGVETYRGDSLLHGRYIDSDGSEHTDRNRAWIDPEFGDSENGLGPYLSSRLKYPEMARRNGIEGVVTLLIAINEEGEIDEIQIRHPSNALLNEAALRIFEGMPVWKAGMRHNRPSRMYMTIPITFRLR